MKYQFGSEEFFNSQDFINESKRTGRDRIFWIIAHEKESSNLLSKIEKLDDVNICDKEGFTYLHIAALNHQLTTVELLLQKGADPNRLDSHGRSAVLLALGRKNPNNVAILKAFLNYGLNLSIIIGNMTIKDHILSFDNEDYKTLVQ